MTKAKKYWKGLAELTNDPAIESLKQNEFAEELPVDKFLGNEELSETSTSRRDFLKFLGFSTAAATLAACEAPVNKAIPYVVKPEEITPGVANWYASTYYDGNDFANILVKTREGRPIFVKGNDLAASRPNARVISSVLSMYDSNRLKSPMKNGQATDWATVDADINAALANAKGDVVVLTNTIISPSTQAILDAFGEKYGAKHVQYDAVSYHGMLEANKASFGLRALPTYHLDKADVILSFGADFLGSWLNVGFDKQYASNRNPKTGKMSRHFQVETNMSLTGSNADVRVAVKPSEQLALIENLYNTLKGNATADARIAAAVKELAAANGRSLVIADSNDAAVQTMVNAINDMLGNYGSTIDMNTPCYLKSGDDAAVAGLVNDMNEGKVAALFVCGVNPAYSLPNADAFVAGLKKVGLTVSTALSMDETAAQMTYVCPDRHNLESWGDANAFHGQYAFMQPTIQPLFDSRQMQDSFLTWTGETADYYAYMQNFWAGKASWSKALHDGVFAANQAAVSTTSFNATVSSIKKASKGLELALYQSVAMGDGQQANNPWLQEMPDPITRACWDNYLTVSASTARELGLKNHNVSNGALNGDRVNLTVGDVTLENVPVLIQPGQALGTVGMAIGYGRTNAGKAGDGVGINAFPLMNAEGTVSITKVEGEHEFASVQLHHTMMGRDMVNETTLADFIKNPKSGNPDVTFLTHEGTKLASEVSLYDEFDHETGHFWNLSIDLTSCIGCGSCVIACHAENNVPVVGKEEIRMSRDMHWLRVDRYYSSDMTEAKAEEAGIGSIDKYKAMEVPSENPEVVFQPVMCQHCNHAPCENVCPVAATSHSAEGQNHMAYNRCVGTRYCANNCPYKVRRFNWFQYSDNKEFDFNMNDDLGKMVLNPDVVVRSRGVMEKCSMCLQMIQKTKLDAKNAGKKVADIDAQTACSIACPTNAMVFGDVNDKSSEVSKLKEDDRQYYLLEALNTAPSVFYQTKIRNKKA
jgi:molybdopterin-containing oxidoreductase family iron-sulfur binding subunit